MLDEAQALQRVNVCRVCAGPDLSEVLDLGVQPLANQLMKGPTHQATSAPLELIRCSSCGVTQLSVDVPAAEMFSDYLWVTGTSESSVSHCSWFAQQCGVRLNGRVGSVLEIASNDGTLLHKFVASGWDALGVDPARNLAAEANSAGIETICDYFSDDFAGQIVSERGQFDLLVARNVLSHVPEPMDLIRGMARALSPDGMAVVEFHRSGVILEELHYDSIYHEHSLYHSLKSMTGLLKNAGLEAFDLLESPISGGSFIVFATPVNHSRQVTDAFMEALRHEDEIGLGSLEAWASFSHRARNHKAQVLDLLNNETSQGRQVVAYGASARSSTLLNFWFPGGDVPINAIADSNPLKQGLHSPGTGVRIVAPDSIRDMAPETIVLLAFNFEEEIRKYLRQIGWSGRLICPLPKSVRIEEFE